MQKLEANSQCSVDKLLAHTDQMQDTGSKMASAAAKGTAKRPQQKEHRVLAVAHIALPFMTCAAVVSRTGDGRTAGDRA
jgi:hypothetical protein